MRILSRGPDPARMLYCVALASLMSFQPILLRAQQLGTDCDLRSFRVLNSQEFIGQRMTWIGLPDLICGDGIRIQADSAVVYEAAGRTEFVGRFRYDDGERELRSESADYFEREARLFARGQVQLIGHEDGTAVRGDTLILYNTGGEAADDRMSVSGRPAFALLYPTDSAATAETLEPYEVTALQLRFEGERFLLGDGEVEVDRDSLHATGRSLRFDRIVGNLILTGDAEMESEGTEFEATTIDLMLPDNELTAITLREEARLLSDDLELLGDEIRIDFADEQMQHLVSVRRPDATAVAPALAQPPSANGTQGGPETEQPSAAEPDDGPRPQAVAEDFILTADSLDVRAPGSILETVHAVGRARGESIGGLAEEARVEDEIGGSPTTTDADSAATAPDSLGIDLRTLDHDWIEGDTIVATFSPVDPSFESPEAGGGGGAYTLDQLVATGSARTLYRSPPEDERPDSLEATVPDRDLWAISYLLADRILMNLVQGQVAQVDAEGSVSGLQLEPELPPAPTEDSPSQDTEEPSAFPPELGLPSASPASPSAGDASR